MKKLNYKRLLWAIKEELGSSLIVVIMLSLVALPWILAVLTDSGWWLLLYLIAFFIGGVWEKYNEK